MIDFFITGLPRTRQAWISNYLSYGDQACIHDGLKYGVSEKNFGFLRYMMDGAKVKGISGCALPVLQDTMIEMNPDAKWIIIQRPFDEVIKSIKGLGVNPMNYIAPIAGKIDELRSKVNPLSVPFDSLNDSIKDIALHINPDWECPKWRHDMLIGMNVQNDAEIGKKELSNFRKDNLLNRRAEPQAMTQANAEALAIIKQICEGYPLALRFLLQAIEAALVWDHIIDSDPIDYDSTNRTFEALITEWMNNKFIIDNARTLSPVMATAIAKWKSGSREYHYSVYIDLASAVAFIIGGMDMVNKYIPRMAALMPVLCKEDDTRDA